MILQSIIEILGNAGITNVYPTVIPQKTELPAAAVFVVSDAPHNGKGETAPVNEYNIQISSFAKTYKESVTLDNQIKTALDNYSASVNSTRVLIKYDNARDLFEDNRIYHRSTDYNVYAISS